jgi:hypothetical protein
VNQTSDRWGWLTHDTFTRDAAPQHLEDCLIIAVKTSLGAIRLTQALSGLQLGRYTCAVP